jgi:hypothetical protein
MVPRGLHCLSFKNTPARFTLVKGKVDTDQLITSLTFLLVLLFFLTNASHVSVQLSAALSALNLNMLVAVFLLN